ncbi:phenylpyruvate tautomerase MIF-related protein [Saccharicrinis sp. FJH54]|uniref:phenylpyruvate tautomerase MIF-related protein n=1 Tax=Saccharicrinis sp. FJH54 TaxID=3344665 RepID=UPI0035D51D39
MPYFRIATNTKELPDRNTFLKECSAFIAGLLNKSEKYVMIELNTDSSMIFGSKTDALAYIELKSIGLPADQTKDFSEKICDFITKHFNIDRSRIYIEFSDVERHKWGWNGSTFA